MKMLKLYFCVPLICVVSCVAEKIVYMSLERPKVSYYNSKYLSYANLTSSRVGRSNPVHYVGLHFYALVWFANNITMDFYFLEFLSNRYKRSFVEMHFRWCDLIHKDTFFGPAFRQGNLDRPCPYPPGDYHLFNMTINPSVIPRSFPFKKGRIAANVTFTTTNELVASGHIDMELKQMHRKKEIKL